MRRSRRGTRGTRGAAGGTAASLDVQDATVALGGHPVLRRASVSIDGGQVLALLGPSGCGKTTLLRAIAGLQALDGGRVHVDGEDLAGLRPERRGIGLVFQHGALFPHLDVGANVGYGLPRAERGGTAVRDALAMVGLAGYEHRSPATLSGGQQQRVALARTLVTRPRVLLLDEPFSSLDAALREHLRRDVADLLRELGTTTVVVTHDQDEALVLGDQVAVMFDGVVHQQARPAELYDRPADRRVAGFIGEVNLVAGSGDGTVARTAIGDLPLAEAVHGPVEVVVRPEHLALTAGDDGRVADVEFFGHDSLVRVVTGPDDHGVLVRSLGAPSHPLGSAVGLAFTGPAATAFPAADARHDAARHEPATASA